jgi:hypothetical protein
MDGVASNYRTADHSNTGLAIPVHLVALNDPLGAAFLCMDGGIAAWWLIVGDLQSFNGHARGRRPEREGRPIPIENGTGKPHEALPAYRRSGLSYVQASINDNCGARASLVNEILKGLPYYEMQRGLRNNDVAAVRQCRNKLLRAEASIVRDAISPKPYKFEKANSCRRYCDSQAP